MRFFRIAFWRCGRSPPGPPGPRRSEGGSGAPAPGSRLRPSRRTSPGSESQRRERMLRSRVRWPANRSRNRRGGNLFCGLARGLDFRFGGFPFGGFRLCGFLSGGFRPRGFLFCGFRHRRLHLARRRWRRAGRSAEQTSGRTHETERLTPVARTSVRRPKVPGGGRKKRSRAPVATLTSRREIPHPEPQTSC